MFSVVFVIYIVVLTFRIGVVFTPNRVDFFGENEADFDG